MNKTVKYPKKQASQEVISKRSLINTDPKAIKTIDNEDITYDVRKISKR